MGKQPHKMYTSSVKALIVLFVLLAVDHDIALAKSIKKTRSKLPSFVKICHRNDPELNVCARGAMNSLKDRLIVGIPELYIPPIEPLVIPQIRMDQDTGAIYLHSTYKNVRITGLSNFSLDSLKIEPEKLKFSLSLSFPSVKMDSNYSMKGKIMMMPLMGSGKCNVNFTDVKLHTELHAQLHKRQGRNFIKIKDIKIRYELGKVQMHLDNLFNGDKALGERMNAFLNENWQSLAEEARPLMQKAIVDVLRASTDKLFDAYSYDELLPV